VIQEGNVDMHDWGQGYDNTRKKENGMNIVNVKKRKPMA
jgi:hypothetical protein